MAEVWVDDGRLGLVCKRIRSDQATNPVFVHQARVEAEALRRLEHPAILRSCGASGDGIWLERGEPLPPGPPASVDAVLAALADALRAAHVAGVVHRDVKAGNLLRVPRGVVLADFGCARIDGWPDPAPGLGSPEAMSPQRLAGAPATPADDWWSLGVLAYGWYAGEAPFPSRRWDELRAQVDRGPPPWPADAPAEVRRWLSPHPSARAG